MHPARALVAAVLASATVLALPAAPAIAGTSPEACDQPLNPDRREVNRFKAGDAVLPYGRVVVQATQANPHRFCIRLTLGGRTVTFNTSKSSDVWRDGRWVSEGAAGSGTYRLSRGYTQTLTVRRGHRENATYQIRDNGRWYSVRISKAFR